MSDAVKYLRYDKNERQYYFFNKRIPRRISQKIKYGKWSCLSADKVLKKLENQAKRKNTEQAYQDVYEDVLETSDGKYYLGIGLEKALNKVNSVLNPLKAEARRLVKEHRTVHMPMTKVKALGT